jgi:hypothetical protein
VSRLMSIGARRGVAKAAVAGVLIASPMVGVTVTAHAAPAYGTSRMPAPADSPAGPNDPADTQAPRTPPGGPSRSNTAPIGPNAPTCSELPHYPGCENRSSSGPHNPGGPTDPGPTHAPRTPRGGPARSNTVPTVPTDPICEEMPDYRGCQGRSSSGPHSSGGPADPGPTQARRTARATPPPRTNVPAAPPNPNA